MTKKISALIGLFITALGGSAFAQIPTNADFLRTLNPAASTEGVSSVLFNPAATAYFKDGFYVMIGDQVSATQRTLYWAGQTKPHAPWNASPLGINAIVLYGMGGASLYGFVASPDRVGDVTYASVYADSTHGGDRYDFTMHDRRWELGLGGSYAVSDYVSFSAGIRVIADFSELSADNGKAGGLYTDKAMGAGFGGQLGFNFTPAHWFTLSINGRTPSFISYTHEVSGTPPPATQPFNSKKYVNTEAAPGSADLGLLFNIEDTVKMMVTVSYLFDGTYALVSGAAGNYVLSKDQSNSLSGGFGLDWQIKHASESTWGLKWGFGGKFIWKRTEGNYVNTVTRAMDPRGMQLQAGTGLVYSPVPFFDVSISAMKMFYLDAPKKAVGSLGALSTNDWYAGLSFTFKPGDGGIRPMVNGAI